MSNDKTAAKDAAPRKIIQVHPQRLFQRESKVREFLIIADVGVEPEDCASPIFWAHIARELVEFTEVTVYCEDWSWRAKFVVIEAGPNWAKVQPLEAARFGQRNEEETASLAAPGYTIKFSGSFSKWRVLRDADKAVIRDKFATKADAELWLAEYSKSLQAA